MNSIIAIDQWHVTLNSKLEVWHNYRSCMFEGWLTCECRPSDWLPANVSTVIRQVGSQPLRWRPANCVTASRLIDGRFSTRQLAVRFQSWRSWFTAGPQCHCRPQVWPPAVSVAAGRQIDSLPFGWEPPWQLSTVRLTAGFYVDGLSCGCALRRRLTVKLNYGCEVAGTQEKTAESRKKLEKFFNLQKNASHCLKVRNDGTYSPGSVCCQIDCPLLCQRLAVRLSDAVRKGRTEYSETEPGGMSSGQGGEKVYF